jgi:hypothetical protein
MAALSSCTTTNKGFQSSTVNVRNVDLDPVKADIKVNENTKLSGSSKSIYFLFFRIQGDNTFADGINYSADGGSGVLAKFNPFKIYKTLKLNGVRSSAAYKALSQGDYDVLIHPNYSMTTKSYLGIVKVYECSVTGYGAKYQNFRTEKQKVIITDNSKEYIFPEK